uniref:Uncharacterized protein n=1 Tax=Megaselia scalaris TaxID=36166 RepID=T1GRW1_MEGSC
MLQTFQSSDECSIFDNHSIECILVGYDPVGMGRTETVVTFEPKNITAIRRCPGRFGAGPQNQWSEENVHRNRTRGQKFLPAPQ